MNIGLLMTSFKPTLQQKYDWLLKQLKVTDVDAFERNALVRLRNAIYFQFSDAKDIIDMDKVVTQAMKDEQETVLLKHGETGLLQ
jgi:hypothetical protein